MDINKKKKNFIVILSCFLIVLLAFKLRLKNYDKIPFSGDSMDEYSYSWVGLSLIELGFPVGNSGMLGAYPFNDSRYINVDRVFQGPSNGIPFKINYPWFDHPPGTGLITGGFTHLKGAQVFEDAGLFLIRKPMVYIGALTTFLLFVFAFQVFGLPTATISSLIHATAPIFIVSSRMIQAENMLVPCFLLSLIFLFQYFKKKKEAFLWLSALAAGSSLLFKISGISIILTDILLLISLNKGKTKKTIKDLIVFIPVSCSFVLFFITFGLVYDARIFWNVLVSNADRVYGIGAQAIYQLINSSPITGGKFLTDGWIISGWISFIALSFNKNKKKISWIFIPILTYLLVYLFFGSLAFGWYRIPLYPFLSISLGYLICSNLKKMTNFITSFILIMLPVGFLVNEIYAQFIQANSSIWKLSNLILIILFIFLDTNSKTPKQFKKIANLLIIGLFIFSVYLNLKFNQIITIDYWYHIH